jgi:hypothetical protein
MIEPPGIKRSPERFWISLVSVRSGLPGSACLLASPHIPQFDGFVLARRRQEVAVGAESHGPYHFTMSLECGHRFACRHVPQIDGLIVTPRRQQLPSGLKATHGIQLSWPFIVACSLLACTSHNLMFPSKLPAASSLPYGLKVTEYTAA